MESRDALERAIALLRSTISNFPIGAVTLSDFKPIEEKIRDSRHRIKCRMARINLIRALNELRTIPDASPENPKELEKRINEIISSHYVHIYKILKNCQQSRAVETILSNDPDIPPEMSSNLQAIMNKLYSQNDKIISLQEEMDMLHSKERSLQVEVSKSIIEFQDFLKEQEQIRNQKLAQSNPEIARKKQKLKNLITKVNISRRILTSLLSAASAKIDENPEFLRMLKDHREIVNAEMIMEMAQNRES